LRPQVLNFNAKSDADKVADDKTEYIHAQTQACISTNLSWKDSPLATDKK
jgi:hypothetical protein